MLDRKSEKRRIGWILAAATTFLLALSAGAVPASADTRGGTHSGSFCVPFSATGAGNDVSDPTEVGVVRTAGTLSVRGQQFASTKAAFTITGTPPPLLTFEGPLTIYPYRVTGKITAILVGSLDPSTAPEANFTAASTSVKGDGQLTGVTGKVQIAGVQNLVDGTFTETLTGKLCVPVGQHRVLARALAGR